MKKYYLFILVITLMCSSCSRDNISKDVQKVIFLHHSTGLNVWHGDISPKMRFIKKSMVPRLIDSYNKENQKTIAIDELSFPKGIPYPWENFPYDYYNIWVLNGGQPYFMEEPTLSTLTSKYDIIVLKHCFPGSNIISDEFIPESLQTKTLGNYKFLYNELKNKFAEYPNTKFIVWTNAALVESATNEMEAKRTREFVDWVQNSWDSPDDNIFIFNFYEIETEGGLYLKPEYAVATNDSHPNKIISAKTANSFVNFLLETID